MSRNRFWVVGQTCLRLGERLEGCRHTVLVTWMEGPVRTELGARPGRTLRSRGSGVEPIPIGFEGPVGL